MGERGASAGGTAGHRDTVQPPPGEIGFSVCGLRKLPVTLSSREGHSIDPLKLEKTYTWKNVRTDYQSAATSVR